ncbi:PEP-CTERM system histidine kinase PrsK [Desulfonema ishimotonii]|uniref:histidine kinase n=1 Tax=Desulfonema ishimotonii TaxID=45657 RepID=A0A401FY66_9BACT|nr:XrtA/PEP-CTERM system histidine kinase PrsK [Desulfonema ishimotonii]GBC61909.1 PEP-CTERM system histidine kinase PrsK [Desulfonema ishimotonii]
MLIYFFYLFNIFLLFSDFRAIRLEGRERRFYLSLVCALLALPLLAGEYFYLTTSLRPEMIPLIFFSESVFAVIWLSASYWLNQVATAQLFSVRRFFVFKVTGSLGAGLIAVCANIYHPGIIGKNGMMISPDCPVMFATNMLVMVSVVVMAWNLEIFWRRLSPKQRWEYKFLVAGCFLTCGTYGWAISYRMTYYRLNREHLHLLSALLVFACGLAFYAMIRHRLLNRKFFISRKVIYAFVAPMTFGLYLTFIGFIVVLMRTFNQPFPVVLRWLLWVAGGVCVAILAVSGKVRHAVRYFVSTHFYNNKYEYRDEWIGFSRMLRGALTEMEVVNALQQVMTDSLYTNIIYIWAGDRQRGYRMVFHNGGAVGDEKEYLLSESHPLITYLQTNEFYHTDQTKYEMSLTNSAPGEEIFFPELGIILCAPLSIGEQTVGVVGLGAEFTGGRYGKDDFDLLAALGTQAASALMAVYMAENLARARQQEAWDVMSAFVLHDMKNAASMLSLMRQNAPAHFDDPDFRQDMLETIDDALGRMGKVQNRLSALKREIIPVWQNLEICGTLREGCRRFEKRIRGLRVEFSCRNEIEITSDPELLLRVIENILLNAMEATGKEAVVRVNVCRNGDGRVIVGLTDEGPGLPHTLLPDAIFEPFRTTKAKGSGIGLWQARRLTSVLGGDICAENAEGGGARFLITLPVEIRAASRRNFPDPGCCFPDEI